MTFRPKVEIVSPTGNHVRYVPRALAGALVTSGVAVPESSKSVALVQCASTHAERIGDPSEPRPGVRFTRWTRLDESGSRVVEHHPRCMWIEY